MEEVMAAVALLQGGDHVQAREKLLALWASLDAGGTHVERCTVAHFLADTEEDVADELGWDLRALHAATGAGLGQDHDPLAPGLDAFLPSLHLNVGDACRRSGDIAHARLHADHGLARAHALPDDGYGGTIRAGLERLRDRAANPD
ncbi:hypothetical protein [Sphingomonas sp. KR3-1]|uniref:hypothetical protein n=1 Tax=Sphingomonas sp. KR3-1 TaxID=3156611 RepID=UPI0032B4E283